MTYRLELQRAVANGVLEAAGSTFLLLIALKYFQAGALAKALVAGGGSAGLMLAPLVVSLVARRGWPAARAAAGFARLGAATFVVMAAVPWLPLYVTGSILGMACAAAVIPLLTQIYQDNYPEAERGRLFARAVMLRIAGIYGATELTRRCLAEVLAEAGIPPGVVNLVTGTGPVASAGVLRVAWMLTVRCRYAELSVRPTSRLVMTGTVPLVSRVTEVTSHFTAGVFEGTRP